MPIRSLGLDFVRSCAVIGVVLVHTTSWIPGAYGVQLFFVISGFLLAQPVKSMSSIQFLTMRWIRLWPLAALMTLLYVNRFTSLSEFISTLLLVHILFLNNQSFPGSWSISAEWLFSIFNVFLAKMTKSSRLFLLFFSLSVLIATDILRVQISGLEQMNVYGVLLLISSFAYFLIGNLLQEIPHVKISLVKVLVLLSPIGIYSIFFYIYPSVYPILVVAFFLACLSISNFPRKIEAVVHFVGKRTYGIFCGHFISIGVFDFYGIHQDYSSSNFVMRLLYFIVVFLTSLGFAQISYKFLEKPSLMFGGRFFKK